jgi:hypothetical protein
MGHNVNAGGGDVQMEGVVLDFGFWICDFGLSRKMPCSTFQNPQSKIQNGFPDLYQSRKD